MNTPFETPKPTSAIPKSLWAAVGVLGIAVVAMGAALIRMETRPEEPRLAALSAAAPAPLVAASSTVPLMPASVAPLEETKNLTPNQAPAPVHHAQAATKSVANTSRRSVDANPATHHPAAQVAPSVCANCGTVAAVTPIQRDGTGSGGGAIAGGVLGAVVGHQVGGGNGNTLATLLGAVGGGFAGNTVEKKMKKVTVYEVQVRMEDGSTRTVEQSTPASVGAKVIVEGNSLQAINR